MGCGGYEDQNEGSVAKGSPDLWRYGQTGETPCLMDGWLYPTYPPLTKGRNWGNQVDEDSTR